MHFRTVSTLDGEALDALIVPVFKDGNAASGAPDDIRATAEWVAREMGSSKTFSPTTHLTQVGDTSTRLIVVPAGKREAFDIQRAWQLVSAGVRALWQSPARRIGVIVETGALDAGAAVQSAVEGVLYAMWRPEAHRTGAEDRRLPPLDEVVILVDGAGDFDAAIRLGEAVGQAVNWSRTLVNSPANLMTPTMIAEAARGSDEPAQFIVMRHHGRAGDGYDLALVGKGISFDSGGISIKPSQDMHLMKYDMSGAASVLAAASVIGRMGLGLNLIAVAPCTENLPGGHATKPGDVFTSMSGKTVEVINTDAEGRLVLIDGVTYAQREGATRVVDVATLTGAITIALGRYYTGLFGRPGDFVEAVRSAGERAGERLWPMPLADEHREEVKSDVADLRNSAGRLGGAILGAAFVDAAIEPQTEWAHLDIAATAWLEEEQPYSPKGPQGPVVKTLVALATTIADDSGGRR